MSYRVRCCYRAPTSLCPLWVMWSIPVPFLFWLETLFIVRIVNHTLWVVMSGMVSWLIAILITAMPSLLFFYRISVSPISRCLKLLPSFLLLQFINICLEWLINFFVFKLGSWLYIWRRLPSIPRFSLLWLLQWYLIARRDHWQLLSLLGLSLTLCLHDAGKRSLHWLHILLVMTYINDQILHLEWSSDILALAAILVFLLTFLIFINMQWMLMQDDIKFFLGGWHSDICILQSFDAYSLGHSHLECIFTILCTRMIECLIGTSSYWPIPTVSAIWLRDLDRRASTTSMWGGHGWWLLMLLSQFIWLGIVTCGYRCFQIALILHRCWILRVVSWIGSWQLKSLLWEVLQHWWILLGVNMLL